ncbi:MAG: hypothetical protein Q4G13_08550 [Moraxella sp.]|nr:hypothetical protein [Moraxella sp.]
MLKVLNDGVQITLNGNGSDPLFIWAGCLVGLAVLVAVGCMVLPVPYAIGSVALLAIFMYFFNQQRHAVKTIKHYHQGVLIIRSNHFSIDGAGVGLSDNAQIDIAKGVLSVVDRGLSYRFVGFDDDKELEIAKKVLQGHAITKNEKTVKMQG